MRYVSIFDLFLPGFGNSASGEFAPYRSARAFRRRIAEYLSAYPDEYGEGGREIRSDRSYSVQVFVYGYGFDEPRRDITGLLMNICTGLYGDTPRSDPEEESRADCENPDEGGWIAFESAEGDELKVLFHPEKSVHLRRESAGELYSRGVEFKLMMSSEELGERLVLARKWYFISGSLICDDTGALIRHEDPADPESAFPEPGELPHLFETVTEMMSALGERRLDELVYENETAIHGELRLRTLLDETGERLEQQIAAWAPGSGETDAQSAADRSVLIRRFLANRRRGLMSPGAPVRLFTPGAGGAGILPAVLLAHIGADTGSRSRREIIRKYILSAGSIAIAMGKGRADSSLYWGCQGEIGVAAAMAAGALAAVRGLPAAGILAAVNMSFCSFIGLECEVRDPELTDPCARREAMGALQVLNAVDLVADSDDASLADREYQLRKLEHSLQQARDASRQMHGRVHIAENGDWSVEASHAEC